MKGLSFRTIAAWAFISIAVPILASLFLSQLYARITEPDPVVVGVDVKPFPTFTPTASPAAENNTSATAQVNVDITHVRVGPGTKYNILGTAFKNDKFDITGKSPGGFDDWWQIDFGGQAGWVHKSAVNTANITFVRTASMIPATTNLSNSQPTCIFYGTEPRAPDPVGLVIRDCETWELAFNIASMDRPDMLLPDYQQQSRIEVTHMVFGLLQTAALNCSTNVSEIANIANVAAEMIEEHGNPSNPDALKAPRIYIIAGLTFMEGNVDECRAMTALILGELIGS